MSLSVFAPYARLSPELEERLREVIGLGLTLRQAGEVSAPANGGPLAKSTINSRLLEVSRLVEAFHKGALEQVPPVALFDGLWVTMLEPTGERGSRRRASRPPLPDLVTPPRYGRESSSAPSPW